MKSSIDRTMTQFRATSIYVAMALAYAFGCLADKAAGQAGAYQLTADELKLDCKKLTGRMKVRILQLRDYPARPQASAASQIARPLLSPFLSGSGASSSAGTGERDAKDRAVLQAYNARLAELKCATFDLESDLKANADADVPTPRQKAKK